MTEIAIRLLLAAALSIWVASLLWRIKRESL